MLEAPFAAAIWKSRALQDLRARRAKGVEREKDACKPGLLRGQRVPPVWYPNPLLHSHLRDCENQWVGCSHHRAACQQQADQTFQQLHWAQVKTIRPSQPQKSKRKDVTTTNKY